MRNVFKATLASVALSVSLLANQQAEVKIGVIMPLSGPLSGFGQSAILGANLMNELAPKLQNGTPIKIIIIDNKSDKIESANAMQKLVASEKVDAVIGALTSTNTLAITKIADDTKTPVVAPVATNDRVTRGRKYVSRVCFADSFQGVIGANLAFNELKARKAAILFDSGSDYSIGLAKVFEARFAELGGKIEVKAQAPAGTKDFRAQLSSIKAKDVDVIYIPVYSNEAALIASQARQLEIKSAFVGSDGLAADKVFFEVGKEATNGFMSTDYYSPDAKQTAKGEAFMAAYKKKYETQVHAFAAMTADAYNVIVNAMNQCANPKDKVCVNEKIRATKDFEGVTGTITLKNGDAIRSAVINEARDGQMVYKTTVNP